MEIERKFLVNNLPNLMNIPSSSIIQAYLCSDPVLRLRKMDEDLFICLKSKGALAREELEVKLTKEKFDSLWSKAEGIPIQKQRYFIPLNKKLTAELDIYEGALQGLITVEVEFEKIEEATAFIPPSWFGKDVTYDNRFKNNQLAKVGLPLL